jgi:hypothetical protein
MRLTSAGVVALLLLLGAMIGASQVWGQSPAPATQIRRVVPRDTEIKIGSQVALKYYQGDTLCMARYIPTLELVTPPSHGTVRFDTADVGVPKGTGCSNSVTGTVVLYQPAPGFVGPDQFTYKLQADPMATDWVGGSALMRYVTLTVR